MNIKRKFPTSYKNQTKQNTDEFFFYGGGGGSCQKQWSAGGGGRSSSTLQILVTTSAEFAEMPKENIKFAYTDADGRVVFFKEDVNDTKIY